MKPNSRKERKAMKNRHLLTVLCAILLITGLFAQPVLEESDWQYSNVHNLVDGGYDGGAGIWIPSWYTTDYRSVESFIPAAPGGGSTRPNFQRRTAFKLDPVTPETNEVWITPNHDQVVSCIDILSGTDDLRLEGVVVTIWGSSDFDPNEDLSPIFPDDAGVQSSGRGRHQAVRLDHQRGYRRAPLAGVGTRVRNVRGHGA